MASVAFVSLAVPTSVASGAGTPVGAIERKAVSLESIGTATYQVQLTLDSAATPAAASWFNEGAALTADGILEVTKPCAQIRVKCTAYTSGTPIGRIAGIRR